MKTKQQPYPKLAKVLGIQEVYFKREDEHKFGSHKGRSIPHMIKNYIKEGIRDFVISSSGNAALAAVMGVLSHNQNNPKIPVTLRVFVGQHIDQQKLNLLIKEAKKDPNITIDKTERPKQAAIQSEKEGVTKNLRQSTDDIALIGYEELAKELSGIPDLQAVFMPTSSGTTAQGLCHTFERLEKKIQVHIIQTTACNPIASAFDTNFTTSDTSLAGAIVDNVAHRKHALIPLLKKSGGSGWVISDEEIQTAIALVKKTTGIDISHTSALSVAGLKKAVSHGWTWNGPVVCIISGK